MSFILGMLPDAIYFTLVLIIAKNIKEKRWDFIFFDMYFICGINYGYKIQYNVLFFIYFYSVWYHNDNI